MSKGKSMSRKTSTLRDRAKARPPIVVETKKATRADLKRALLQARHALSRARWALGIDNPHVRSLQKSPKQLAEIRGTIDAAIARADGTTLESVVAYLPMSILTHLETFANHASSFLDGPPPPISKAERARYRKLTAPLVANLKKRLLEKYASKNGAGFKDLATRPRKRRP